MNQQQVIGEKGGGPRDHQLGGDSQLCRVLSRGPGLALVGVGQLLNSATFKTIGAKGAGCLKRFVGPRLASHRGS